MKYRIAASANSWNIEERRTVANSKDESKIGTSNWVAIKFYGKVEQAAKSLLQILAAEKLESDHTLQDIIDSVKSSETEVIKVIREIGIS